jgi:preprotein translocase SecF subunit
VRDFVGKRRWFYAFSAAVIVPGLIFILLTVIPGSGLGLRFSIAYTGGTIWEVHFEEGAPRPDAVRAVLERQGLEGSEVAITTADAREYVLIRTEALTLIDDPQGVVEGPGTSPDPAGAPDDVAVPPGTEAGATPGATEPGGPAPDAGAASPAPADSPDVAPVPPPPPLGGAGGDGEGTGAAGAEPVQGVPTEGEFGALAAALQEEFGRIDEVRQQTSVGPVVSGELVQQTFLLILIGALGIMIWITYRFGDFRMGAAAIGALVHDVLVVVGIFAILGTALGVQIDALFVTAMLTVIGFSVHDTIVVFDRIRENKVRHAGEPMDVIINHSILQTLGRSINTSLTVVLPLTALLLFGGNAINAFVLALLIGIVSGTYSSICTASQLYLDWHLRDDRRRTRRLAEAGAT